MQQRQWTVDAFASGPFKGNPACVVEPFSAWPGDSWLQGLARENNQAETAFLLQTPDPERFQLRWFTPKTEVPLCGHATLASAHVLFRELGLKAEQIEFDTSRSGRLSVRRAGGLYEMDFPADPPRPAGIPEGPAEALGAEPAEVWAGAYLVALFDDPRTVRNLTPNLTLLETIGGEATGGPGQVVVAAPSDERRFDVIDRFFAPGCGVAEDPATGSAHCIVGPLFARRLGRPLVRFLQVFPGRGGEIEAETQGDRVLLRGGAHTVIESRLRV